MSNKIVFEIPVHVMNLDSVLDGVTRKLSMQMKVAGNVIFDEVHAIDIGVYVDPATPYQTPNPIMVYAYCGI